jgi:hypothetical protein
MVGLKAPGVRRLRHAEQVDLGAMIGPARNPAANAW